LTLCHSHHPWLAGAALAVASLAAAGEGSRLEEIRAGLTPGKTRLVLDLTAPAEFVHRSAGTEEAALVLDLPGVNETPDAVPQRWPGDLVTDVQLKRREAGGLRVTVTLSRCSEMTLFTLRPHAGRPDRIVIDLRELSAEHEGEPSGIPVGPGCVSDETLTARETKHAREPAGRSDGRATPDEAASAGSTRQNQASVFPTVTASIDPESGADWQFTATWEHEWAAATEGGSQKFESLVQPRLDWRLSEGLTMTAIARLRLDAIGDLGPDSGQPANYSDINGFWYNSEKAALDLREVFLDWDLGDTFLRLGRQQVVWGQADGFKVLDVVNPQSFREFILDDFDDSRIPLWMANVEWSLGAENTLQLLWIPDPTYHELAEPGTPYMFTSPLLIPAAAMEPEALITEPERPGGLVEASDLGARYRTFVKGWDLSLNYLYSYGDLPVFLDTVTPTGTAGLTIYEPEYRRNHLFGGTATTTAGSIVLRLEAAWNSERWFPFSSAQQGPLMAESAELSSVVGIDWQRGSGSLLSAQWFYSLATDHHPSMERGSIEQMVSLLMQETFLNDSWQLRALALHSLDFQDTMLQLRLKHWLTSRIEAWIGTDLFFGDRRGLFGQFDEQDRILFGVRVGF